MRPWLLLVAVGVALSLCGCVTAEPNGSSSASSSSHTEFDHDFSEPHSSSATQSWNEGGPTRSMPDAEHSVGGPHVKSFLATVDWIDDGDMQVTVLDPQSGDANTVFVQYGLDYLMDGTLMSDLRAGDKINVDFITSGSYIPAHVDASSITLAEMEA